MEIQAAGVMFRLRRSGETIHRLKAALACESGQAKRFTGPKRRLHAKEAVLALSGLFIRRAVRNKADRGKAVLALSGLFIRLMSAFFDHCR